MEWMGIVGPSAEPESTVVGATVLGGIIVVSGIMGGGLAYLHSREDTPRNIDDEGWEGSSASFGTAVLQGVVAALVVPLFLSITGSTLVDEVLSTRTVSAHHFRVVGLCLVAALASRTFLARVGASALGSLKELEGNQKSIEATVERVITAVTSSSTPLDKTEEYTAESRSLADTLGPVERSFLATFADEERVFMKEDEIREKLGGTLEQFERSVTGLLDKGLVSELMSQRVKFFFLPIEGRRVGEVVKEQSE